jgi:hypothetical protein
MKYITVLAMACLLSECAMTADDWKTVGAAVDTGVRTYQQVDRQRYVIGYDQFGNPIFRQ